MSKHLISDDYRAQNATMHGDLGYGTGGLDWAENLAEYINSQSFEAVLDYGAGKQVLTDALRQATNVRIDAYDPAIDAIKEIPLPKYDLIICKDVMEHVEPLFLDNVLEHQASLTRHFCCLLTALIPANRILPDGRNAHLILESHEWWVGRVSKFFDIAFEQDLGPVSMIWGKPKVANAV